MNAWLDEHLTPDGRKRMLAALRRQRADENSTGLKSKPVRLCARTYNDLKTLADQLGVKRHTSLCCPVQILLADKSLQSCAEKLALAMQHKVGNASLSAGPSMQGSEPWQDTDPA